MSEQLREIRWVASDITSLDPFAEEVKGSDTDTASDPGSDPGEQPEQI